MTSQTSSIQTGSLVQILRGRRAGEQFVVLSVHEDDNGRFAEEEGGIAHKFGNLVRIEQPSDDEVARHPEDFGWSELNEEQREQREHETSADAQDEMPLCQCGCGQAVLKNDRIYRQGHDQRHKGILIRAARKEGNEAAAGLLIAKGWKTEEEAQLLLQEYAEKNG